MGETLSQVLDIVSLGLSNLKRPEINLPHPANKLMLDRLTSFVAVCNPYLQYVFINRELLKFVGCSRAELVGKPYAEVYNDELFDYAELRNNLLQGEALQISGWHLHRLGRRVYVEETFLPFANPDGTIHAIGVFSRDLTTLKEREEELAGKIQELDRSEALKAAIFDHALVALVSADEQGRVVEFNPAAEVIFVTTRAFALGQPLATILGVPALQGRGLHEMEAGKRHNIQARRSDGDEFPIEMVLWRTSVAQTIYYTVSVADLTERQEAGRQIEYQREALRQGEKLNVMGNLLAGVAHELNNPLAIAMGRASLLEEKCQDPRIQSDARRVREAAERCGRIVRTFLNMARGRPSQRSNVNLNDLVRAAVDMLQYAYRTHNIDLVLQLANQLPAVHADADQLNQVVMNLMVNAQHALSEVEGTRQITLSTGVLGAGGSHVWLRIADTGPGVPQAMHARIFEPFVTTKPEGMGTGLGLSVSRSLAQAHGGDLELEPSHAGATFCLTLPVNEAKQ
jgi:PAS domain S-box-containing protein